MSGHSKWETTKRQKAVVDAKRGAVFTKLGNMIAIAARSGARCAALSFRINSKYKKSLPPAQGRKARGATLF